MVKQGTWLSPAVEGVYLRHFSKANPLTPFWSMADREGYLAQINKTLAFFWPDLSPQEDQNA